MARKEKLIIDVELGNDCNQGIWKARDAFQKFHADTKNIAIAFKLPEHPFKECETFQKLGTELIPYQAAILAAELDFRLYPFLPSFH